MKNITPLFLALLLSVEVSACSSFFFNSNTNLLAKNFDWYSDAGYILKNPRNQKKFSYGFRSGNVASWTSKFGSVTFNQNGKEFPYGGINEKGLAIEQLWLSTSQYQDNSNQEISELEWIQYQLDNFQTVQEVIENVNSLTIKPIASVHFMIADKTGNSAIIEFIDGKVEINSQNSKSQVITNETLKDSKKYFNLKRNINPESRTHFDRYCILENNLNTIQNLTPIDAFKHLDDVKVEDGSYKTYWSIVYDLNESEIYFQSFKNEKIKKISLADFNFDTGTEFSEINSDKVDFKPYSEEDNLKLLSSSIKVIDKNIDIKLASNHQMQPDKIVEDKIYQENYADLTVEFYTMKNMGNIYYRFTKENMNNDFLQGMVSVSAKATKLVLYGFPKGEFVLKCFQDLNDDGKIDKNIFGIPIRTGFSNNRKKIFGIPPNYETAKINLKGPKTIKIKIK